MLLFAIALLPLADGGASRSLTPTPQCEDPRLHQVRPGAPVDRQRLGELPPAQRVLTVERRIGDCSKVVLVRDERR